MPSQKKRIALTALALSVALSACAEKKTRLWIDPPIGTEASERSPNKLYYQIEDVQSGKRESVSIPLQQMPENLVVQQKATPKTEDGLALATQADRQISDGKAAAPAKSGKPTVSYLRGLSEVEGFYQKRQFSEALVRLAPLIDQYPKQSRLFTMQGTLYRKIGEKKLAAQSYKRAQELDRNDPMLEEAMLKSQDEAGENL